MRIALGSDHAGFGLKSEVAGWLKAAGHEVVDVGAHSRDSIDYPKPAHEVAVRVARGEVDRGVLVCGSGIGVSIAANRHKGVRAANCTHQLQAELSRKHNDANVLALGSRIVHPGLARRLVRIWLATPFEGGRHQARIDKITALERGSGG